VTNPAAFDEDIAIKIAVMIRLLLSDKIGEADAAAQVLPRTLRNAGTDVIDKIAELITSPFDENAPNNNGQLLEAEMREIFDAGVKEGLKRAAKSNINATNTIPMPSARDMAMYCYQHFDALNEWERGFITNMMIRTRRGPLYPKQQDKLEQIYINLGGRI
jgi:hypothetical protein